MAKIIIEVCWDKSFTEELIKRNYDAGSMFDTAIRMGLQEAVVVSNEQDIVKPYLDKIRAEIINKSNEPNYLHKDEDWSVGLEMALEIIDKHKAKSEEKNICSTCANANNVVVCPYTIKDIAAEEGCKFWHETERSE